MGTTAHGPVFVPALDRLRTYQETATSHGPLGSFERPDDQAGYPAVVETGGLWDDLLAQLR